MKPKAVLSVLLIGSLLLVITCLALAHDNAKHPTTGDPLRAESFRAAGPVSVDANLDEWAGVVPAEIEYVEQVNVRPENWEGADDGSVQVFCMWDDSFIYMAAVATDDVLVANKTEDSIWQQDCIEVFLSPGNEDVMPEGWPHDTHYQFGLAASGPAGAPQKYTWCDPEGNPNHVPDYIDIAASVPDPYAGYIIEASISLAAVPKLAEKVGADSVIGYHLSMDDADGQGEPDSHITWSGGGPHDDGFFGNLTFVGSPAAISPQGKAAVTWGSLKGRY